MDTKVKYSIIIPAYNADLYIADAIRSVLVQQYANFEVIVVDDGSIDKTYETVAAIQDNRVTVYKQKTGYKGVSDARNYGISLATGDYILFLDADDFYCNDILFREINEFIDSQESDIDVICFGYRESYNRNFNIRSERHNGIIQISVNEILERTICMLPSEYKDMRLRAASSCTKMYKKNFLINNDIQFPSRILNSEDAIFNLRVMRHYPHICVIDIAGYFYWNNNNNSGHRYMPEFYYEFDNMVSTFMLESSPFVEQSMERRKWLRIYSYIYKVLRQCYFHPNVVCEGHPTESIMEFIGRPIVKTAISNLEISDFSSFGKITFIGIKKKNIFMLKMGMVVFPKLCGYLRILKNKFV